MSFIPSVLLIAHVLKQETEITRQLWGSVWYENDTTITLKSRNRIVLSLRFNAAFYIKPPPPSAPLYYLFHGRTSICIQRGAKKQNNCSNGGYCGSDPSPFPRSLRPTDPQIIKMANLRMWQDLLKVSPPVFSLSRSFTAEPGVQPGRSEIMLILVSSSRKPCSSTQHNRLERYCKYSQRQTRRTYLQTGKFASGHVWQCNSVSDWTAPIC